MNYRIHVMISRHSDSAKSRDKDLKDVIASLQVTLKDLFKAQHLSITDEEIIIETRFQSPFDVVPTPFLIKIEMAGHPMLGDNDVVCRKIAEEMDRTIPEHMQEKSLITIMLTLGNVSIKSV